MKTVSAFILTMLLAFSLQAQEIVDIFGQKEYGIHRSLPQCFIQKRPIQPSKNEGLKVQGKGLVYYGFNTDNPTSEITFHYNKDGLLLHTEEYPFPNNPDYLGMIVTYNGTFCKEGENIVDTIITYYQPDFKIPYQRYYYDYHYYDVSPVDSFYVEYICQEWNQTNKKWINISKEYEGYIDTVLFEINRIEAFSGDGDGWKIVSGMRDSLVYDAHGNVTELYRKTYESKTGKYEWWYKRVNFLDEDGSINEFYAYYYKGNKWSLSGKAANIAWLEWHGYGGFCPVIYVGYEPSLIGHKRNKMKSYSGYEWINEAWNFLNYYKYDWEFDDYGSHIDSAFYAYNNEIPSFPSSVKGNFYNQYGDYVEYRSTLWYPPDENGFQKRIPTCIYLYDFHYNEYGYDREEDWMICWNNEIQGYDSTMTYKIVITEFIDPAAEHIVEQTVNCLLSIAPNPVSGVVTIAAATEIKQLQIFDITGKLMKEQVVSSDKAVFDTGNLPKGIYIVQALLQNGERQMGKLVVP